MYFAGRRRWPHGGSPELGQLEKGVQGGGFLYLKLHRVEAEKVAWSRMLKEARTCRNHSTELEEWR